MTKAAALVRKDDITEPEDDESYSEFMGRCVFDEGNDEDECQIAWDDRAGDGAVIHKTSHATKADGLDFVLSDETPDRYGDVISADGWTLDNFKKNPIALFGHNSSFPIGNWQGLHVKDGALRGHLQLAPAGTSERIDEIRKLVEAGILRAVSVGFVPIEKKTMDSKADDFFGPFKYLKQELVETSLVSIPANPNALAIAKSLKVSDDTIRMVFAKHGDKDTARQRQARLTSRTSQGKPMSTLAQRIKDSEQRLLAARDKLSAHLEKSDDNNVTDADLEARQSLNDDIVKGERTLESLRESEKLLGAASEDGGRAVVTRSSVPAVVNGSTALTQPARPFSVPAKKMAPLDFFVRAGTIQILAHRDRKPLDEIRRAIYGDDEATRAVLEWQTKAAAAVAMTTTVGWAAELVQQIVVDFMATLMPKSVFPRLSGAGLSLTFGRNGKIIIPTRARTPTIAGSFVGEGLPIPVRQGLFTSQTLTPKKMGVITTWTREIDEHSVPAIEGLLRDAIQMDTAVSLDAVLLDANPATTVRPPGILNGVSGLTPTAGGGFNALVGDIKQLTNALLTGTLGNIRNPVWLMNPAQVNSIGLVAAPGAGVFPFRDEIGRGTLGGWPVIDSGTVPINTVIVVDAADFVSVSGDAPRFEISDQATLHMEDTTPTDISTAGTPAVVAFPAKSMFQTDSMALRLILPINWCLRRTGVVAWVAGVTW
jgi:HK97 family phage prohead protease/HK97 family phage major capsid protein